MPSESGNGIYSRRDIETSCSDVPTPFVQDLITPELTVQLYSFLTHRLATKSVDFKCRLDLRWVKAAQGKDFLPFVLDFFFISFSSPVFLLHFFRLYPYLFPSSFLLFASYLPPCLVLFLPFLFVLHSPCITYTLSSKVANVAPY